MRDKINKSTRVYVYLYREQNLNRFPQGWSWVTFIKPIKSPYQSHMVYATDTPINVFVLFINFDRSYLVLDLINIKSNKISPTRLMKQLPKTMYRKNVKISTLYFTALWQNVPALHVHRRTLLVFHRAMQWSFYCSGLITRKVTMKEVDILNYTVYLLHHSSQ